MECVPSGILVGWKEQPIAKVWSGGRCNGFGGESRLEMTVDRLTVWQVRCIDVRASLDALRAQRSRMSSVSRWAHIWGDRRALR